jgi:arylsulfatase A-like enzyme
MIALILFLACGANTPESPPIPPPVRADLPNIVLITLDTTRADAMGSYGGPEGISPAFDAVAAEGIQFDWAFSHSPTTLSAHSSIFTGFDPHGHAVPRNGFPLGDAFETLAERLQSQGYDTLGVVAASVLNREMGMAQGFRLFNDDTPTDMGRRYEDRADRVTRRALELIAQREPNRPFFLWVHYYDAHSPYDAPKDFQSRFTRPNYRSTVDRRGGYERLADVIRAGRFPPAELAHLKGLYFAEIAWVDNQMERLLKALESDGLLKNSLTAITADHGEAFAEGHFHPVGHGHDVDTWATHVPLVIRGRGSVETTPQRINQTVKVSDLGTTLLSLAKLEPRLGKGQDLNKLIQGEALVSTPVFMEASKPKQSEIPGRWNNIGHEQGLVDGRILYINNPRARPVDRVFSIEAGTQKPLDDPEALTRMRALWEGWNELAPPYREEVFSKDMEEALRALGYLE